MAESALGMRKTLTCVYRNERSNRAEICRRYFPRRPRIILYLGYSARHTHQAFIWPSALYYNQVNIDIYPDQWGCDNGET